MKPGETYDIPNFAHSRTIGTVESVAPDEIKVLLDIDAPRNTALNTGVPTTFPKINSYVLLPNEMGAVVGIVVWLGVERSAYPKRQGLKDFGLIDLPFPLRKLVVNPIGTLLLKKGKYSFERGVKSFPSVGDSVIIPTHEQTIAIVTGCDTDSRIKLGTCPSAYDAHIAVDPDKLFGRHLAILGNTGSGKSCTLASLIRSSIESAQEHIQTNKEQPHQSPNARFIVLDPNGEYSKCFQDMGVKCRVFSVNPEGETGNFTIPAWMWNNSEWASVAQAAPKTQRPLLQTALRELRSGTLINTLDIKAKIRIRCRTMEAFLMRFMGVGAIGFKESNSVGEQLAAFEEDISYWKGYLNEQELLSLIQDLNEHLEAIIAKHDKRNGYFRDFSATTLLQLTEKIDTIYAVLPKDIYKDCVNEDLPVRFDIENLSSYLQILAFQEGGSISQFLSTLLMRIDALLADTRMKNVINPQNPPTLKDWLENHIGANNGVNGPITVIDLSLVPYEILHLVIAVASRLIFEALQRYRKKEHKNLPTVLVLEEAHTFISKKRLQGDDIPNPADMCRTAFERIAREGRKFGLGLVLSSQRPSELSETVLSQCNSFLLHRITNDRDQELINRLVPDTARGLLKELPSLPTRHCILLGISAKVPVLIEVNNLSTEHRPESDDPDFWDVWTLESERNINWETIVEDWVKYSDNKTL